MKHPTALFVVFLLFITATAQAACPARGAPKGAVRARNGRTAYVNPSAVNVLTCVVRGLEGIGYPIKWIGGYGCRDLRTSLHPRGLAMDVNQSSRDITSPRIPRGPANQVARNCNAVHGAVWRNPDAGHFEVRSMSRQQQRIGRTHRRR